MKEIVQKTLLLVNREFCLDINGIHGIHHWARVYNNAMFLCEAMELNSLVPSLFSVLHDAKRISEDEDLLHGNRAADWVDELVYNGKLKIDSFDQYLLTEAISLHSFGYTEAHPIIQVCWDADRLDLGRVGIVPDPVRLCTETAKNATVILTAFLASSKPPLQSQMLQDN